MAEVPAVTDQPVETMESTSGSGMGDGGGNNIDRFDNGADMYRRNDVASGFMKLPLVRQIGLMVGFAAVISFAILLILWSQDPEYKPLYNNLEASESSMIVNVLEEAAIPFTVDPSSGMVLVPSKEIHNARMKVAAADILTTKSEGYVILDQEQELGTSQFMETARYHRAIEGELARTISSLKNISKARVMLAIPKQSVFVRDLRKPSASVFVEVASGRDLEAGQVKAIMHLVAHSVPEMHKDQVTVVDQHGKLLSDLEDNSAIGQTEKQFKFSQKVERDMLSKIEKILNPIVGDGRFNAQVAADVDFTWVEETQEMFNPDLPAIRSEETLNEIRAGGELAGIPGALTNQPPEVANVPQEAFGAGGQAAASNISKQRTQSTRNYELDRTISHTRHPVGRVSRLTIAVVLDDLRLPDAETGELQTVPWDAASLERMRQLVRDAVGYSAVRGDRVTVINEAFMPVERIIMETPGFWTETWFVDLIKLLLVGLMIIFLTFFVLRPVLSMLAGPSAEDRMKELMAEQELERLAEQELEQEEEMMQETVTLSGGEELLLPGPGDLYGRQLDAIRSLVDENPSRVAQVVKEWVSAEA